MVYSKKLVAAVKVNGKVLRESGDTVSIPFGSEYSILLKNLNSVRVQVKVSVDGNEATDGTWLIVEPNSSVELERFIRNGNYDKGNRFKFIERTKEIEDHRGIEAEDGLIRVEYKTERRTVEQPVVIEKHHYRDYYHDYWYPYNRPYNWPSYTCSGGSNNGLSGGMITRSDSSGSLGSAVKGVQGGSQVQAFNVSLAASDLANDAGITVPGSESDQKFTQGAWFATESQSEVLVLKLRGVVAGRVIKQAVTVEHKPKCVTCGRVNKANNKFCSQCGTALQII